MSGTTLAGGVLTITGTDSEDLVRYWIPRSGRLQVSINDDTSREFRLNDITRIEAFLMAGTDVLQAIPGKPLSADLGDGTVDRIEVNSTSANDLIEVFADHVAIGSQAYSFTHCENVYVSDPGGNDTLSLLSSAGVGEVNVVFMAGAGADVFEANAPWTGAIRFEGGDNDDRLLASAATQYDYPAGGGTDSMVMPTTDQSDLTSIKEWSVGVYPPGGSSNFVRSANIYDLEQVDIVAGPSGAASGAVHAYEVTVAASQALAITIEGSADVDHATVKNSALGPTAANINFRGNGGDDVLEMQNGVRLTSTYDGGAGNDSLVFSSGDLVDTIVADADSVNDATSRVDYLAVENAELRGELGNDTFQVTPAAQTGFFVRGHRVLLPKTDPLDRLQLDVATATPTSLTYTTSTAGVVTFSDRKPVSFTDIDQLTGLEAITPVANPGGPYEVVEGKSIQLDGSASRGFHGSIVRYEWDLNYDGSFNLSYTGLKPTFSAAGLHPPLVRTVALRVIDQGGRVGMTTTTVTLKPTQVPVANINGPYEVFRNGTVYLSYAGSYDSDGTILYGEWDLNYDGTTFDVDTNNPAPYFNANGLAAGTVRTLAMRVVDDSFARSAIVTTTLTVKISAPPTINANGPYTTAERSSVLISASGTAGAGDAVMRYDWDLDYDGVTFNADVQQSGYPVSYKHAWDGPGTRTIAARITTHQDQTAIATAIVNVVDVAPAATASGPASVDEGGIYTLTLDDGNDVGDTITAWRIDWGDGIIDDITGNPSSATHTYADGLAEYVIKAWAIDEDGEHLATVSSIPGGTLDSRFGTGGMVTTHISGPSESIGTLLRRPDDKLIAVGRALSSNTIALVRYLSDGSLDPLFGVGGRTNTSLGASPMSVQGASLLPDGRILVLAGYENNVTFVRYTADGALDTTFDGDGILTHAASTGFTNPTDLLVLPDGRLRVAGSTINSGTNMIGAYGFLADGSPDPEFGNNGLVKVALGGVNWSSNGSHIALEADGRLLVAGSTSDAVVIARLSATGQADGSFGAATNGYASINRGDFDSASDLVVQPDGKVLVAAASNEVVNGVGQRVGSIYRLNANGTPDSSFGVGNRRLLHNGSWAEFAEDLAVDADGRIYAAGNSPVTVSAGVGRFQLTAFRLTPSGAFDTTFGTNGRMRANFGTGGTRNSQGYAIALDVHRFYVGGYADVTGSASNDYAIARGMVGTPGLVTVENVAPVIAFQASATAQAGTPLQIEFSATDPGDDTIASWLVDWGDGTVETLNGTSTGAAHTYDYGATRTIRVTATDDDGAYSAAPVNVAVAPPTPDVDNGGILRVWGGDAVDTIDISVSGANLAVLFNGVAFSFDRAAVTGIDVRTYKSVDVITLGAGVPTGSVQMGEGTNQGSLYIAGPLSGSTPLAVNQFGGTAILEAGVLATFALVSYSASITLRGTDGDDTWSLQNNRAAGAGTEITWPDGILGIRVDGLGGDDTFDVENSSSPNASRPLYTLNGGAGNDTARLTAGVFAIVGAAGGNGTFTYNGGEGDDRLETASGLRGGATFVGDAGNDTLVFNGEETVDWITTSDTQVRRADSAGSNNIFYILGRNETTSVPWENVHIYGLGGNDVFAISALKRPVTLLDGGAGEDSFTFNTDAGLNAWQQPTEVRGGDGIDTITINEQYSSGAMPRSYVLDATGVQRDSSSRRTFDSVEAVTLNGGGGPDTFTITPATAVTFTVNGGMPTSSSTPADTIVLNYAGATGAALANTDVGAGAFTFDNRQPIYFAGIEAAALLPSWLASGSGATWNPTTKTLTITGATTITADPGVDVPTINASGAAAVLTINPTSALVINVAALNLSNGARATLTSNGAGNRVFVVGNGGLSLDAASTLDLADHSMVLRNANSAAAEATRSTVNGWVRNAFNEFAWDQPGVTSSTVQADLENGGAPSSLGILLNNDGNGNPLFFGDGTDLPKFENVAVDANSVLVRYTRLGDLNLDRAVDFQDLSTFNTNFDNGLSAGRHWSDGDLNYDGRIDFQDLSQFNTNYPS